MNSKFRILSQIARGAWMVEPTMIQGYLPFLDALFTHTPEANSLVNEQVKYKQSANENVNWNKLNAATKLEQDNYWRSSECQFYFINPNNGQRNLFINDAVEGSIMVIPVEDVVMRYDFCGTMGLETIEQAHAMGELNPKVQGFLYKFHTPGGSVDYLHEMAMTIANSSKPTVGFISGLCASAGMYLCSQCDYVIAENDFSLIGSIGVVATLVDTRKRDEQMGVRRIAIYGPQSIFKNKVYADAIDGKTDPIINEQLAPLNDAIVNAVKSGRGSRINENHPTALKGATFMSLNAKDTGLFDEINSFAYAIKIASGFTPSITQNQNQNTNMFNKFPKLTALAGKPSADITAAELDAVNAELKERGVNAVIATEATLQEQITAETKPLENKVSELNNKLLATTKAEEKLLAAVKVFNPEATAETAATFDLAANINTLKNVDAADEAKLKAEKEKATGDANTLSTLENTSIDNL